MLLYGPPVAAFSSKESGSSSFPAIYAQKEYVNEDGLVSYREDVTEYRSVQPGCETDPLGL
jgi:hypothetical protein